MKLKLFLAAIFGLFAISSCSEQAKVQLSPEATKNLQTADEFLAQNATKPGVVTTKSGLQYQVISSGDPKGKKPVYSSIVRANYEGTFLNGEVFDSSFQRGMAMEFAVNELIPAWTEALLNMHPGDEWVIWVHPKIGYGPIGMPQGCGGKDNECIIPPNSLLVFRMQLLSIVNADEIAQEMMENEIIGSDGKLQDESAKH